MPQPLLRSRGTKVERVAWRGCQSLPSSNPCRLLPTYSLPSPQSANPFPPSTPGGCQPTAFQALKVPIPSPPQPLEAANLQPSKPSKCQSLPSLGLPTYSLPSHQSANPFPPSTLAGCQPTAFQALKVPTSGGCRPAASQSANPFPARIQPNCMILLRRWALRRTRSHYVRPTICQTGLAASEDFREIFQER